MSLAHPLKLNSNQSDNEDSDSTLKPSKANGHEISEFEMPEPERSPSPLGIKLTTTQTLPAGKQSEKVYERILSPWRFRLRTWLLKSLAKELNTLVYIQVGFSFSMLKSGDSTK